MMMIFLYDYTHLFPVDLVKEFYTILTNILCIHIFAVLYIVIAKCNSIKETQTHTHTQ